MTRYAIDTNLYVRAFRDAGEATALDQFMTRNAPRCYLHSVVLHELLVGALSPDRTGEIEAEIAEPLARRRRIVTPSHRSWSTAGKAVARLAARKRLDLRSLPCSFVHDALIAASCAEAGVTLVTDNERDFRRLQDEIRFEFAAPWP